MLSTTIRVLLASLTALLCSDAVLARAHEHSYLLNLPGITAIAYRSYFVNEVLSRRCDIDRYAWDESVRAVTARSTKLKFIPNNEYEEQLGVRFAKVEAFADSPTLASDERELTDYYSIPKLVLSVTSFGTRNGCIGRFAAVLELTNVIPVRRIWYISTWFAHPPPAAQKLPWYGARVLSHADENYTDRKSVV